MEGIERHYAILGLSGLSGKERSKLSTTEIRKAYKKKALEIHPDKRPHDKNALTKFQQLHTSYEILTNPEKVTTKSKNVKTKSKKTNRGPYNYSVPVTTPPTRYNADIHLSHDTIMKKLREKYAFVEKISEPGTYVKAILGASVLAGLIYEGLK